MKVEHDLFGILGKCTAEFEKTEHVKVVQPFFVGQDAEKNQGCHDDAGSAHAENQYPRLRFQFEGKSLAVIAVIDNLHQVDKTERHGVHRKGHIVALDGGGFVGKAFLV